MTDPIADMLTRIRNAAAVKKADVVLPYSNIKFQIANVLASQGYVGVVEKQEHETFPMLRIELKYDGKNSVIRNIKKISTPGRRIYRGKAELPVVLNNLGIAVISTSGGIMTNIEARKKGLGGEIICEVY